MHNKVYRIEYTKEALKYLLKMPSERAEDVRSAFYRLAQWVPTNLDIRRLQGFTTPTFWLRVGGYRAIFRYEEDRIVLVVLTVWPRWDVYK